MADTLEKTLGLEKTFGLTGKKAIVTGGARGIGQTTAEMMAACGATVVIADMNRKGGEAAARDICERGGKASFVAIDVADKESVAKAFAEADKVLGGLDILVNNAAMIGMIPLLEIPVDYWDAMQAVNVRGPFLCMCEAVKRMRDGGGGSIVNISSSASIRPVTNAIAAYAASKGAVNAMTKSVALDFAADNIRVNAVMPHGISHKNVATQLDEANQPYPTGPAADEKRYLLGRNGVTRDLAAMVTFLSGPGARYVTGQVFSVDGGFLIS